MQVLYLRVTLLHGLVDIIFYKIPEVQQDKTESNATEKQKILSSFTFVLRTMEIQYSSL